MSKKLHPLARVRRDRKVSQAELARIIGLKAKSSISEIENKTRVPTVRVALAIERWSGGAVSAASLNPLLKQAARQAAA